MGTTKSAKELAPELRDAWIEQHSEYRQAKANLERAQAAAENPPRDDDPIQYVNNAFAARRDLEHAKSAVAELRAGLANTYDTIHEIKRG